MAGITNTAFRRLCREYGAGLYVSEMITTRALVEGNATTLRLTRHHESETPRSLPLYGVDPATDEEAVRLPVEQDRAGHTDLHFRCPVQQVPPKGGGAAPPSTKGVFRATITRAGAAGGGVPGT